MLTIPTQDYRRSDYRVPPRPLTGLDALVNGIIGKYQRRNKVLESLKLDADAVVAQEREWRELPDAILQIAVPVAGGGAAPATPADDSTTTRFVDAATSAPRHTTLRIIGPSPYVLSTDCRVAQCDEWSR